MPSSRKEDRRARILIVEDDDLMQVFYERLFKRHEDEFIWHLKPSAEDGLAHLRVYEIDVVVLDWDLPRINGLQLLRAIRANPATRDLPVILASGRTSPGYEALALKHGASAYLAKPFETGKLLIHLRGFGRRRGG